MRRSPCAMKPPRGPKICAGSELIARLRLRLIAACDDLEANWIKDLGEVTARHDRRRVPQQLHGLPPRRSGLAPRPSEARPMVRRPFPCARRCRRRSSTSAAKFCRCRKQTRSSPGRARQLLPPPRSWRVTMCRPLSWVRKPARVAIRAPLRSCSRRSGSCAISGYGRASCRKLPSRCVAFGSSTTRAAR